MDDQKITLELTRPAFDCLTKTIEGHRQTLHIVDMNRQFKESLINDIATVQSIIRSSKREDYGH